MLLSSPHPSAPNIQIGFADLIKLSFLFLMSICSLRFFGSILVTYCPLFQLTVVFFSVVLILPVCSLNFNVPRLFNECLYHCMEQLSFLLQSLCILITETI